MAGTFAEKSATSVKNSSFKEAQMEKAEFWLDDEDDTGEKEGPRLKRVKPSPEELEGDREYAKQQLSWWFLELMIWG
jgi:hypothetical protein